MTEYRKFSFSMPKYIVDLIDQHRGDIPRSRFIVRALEAALKIPEKERVVYD